MKTMLAVITLVMIPGVALAGGGGDISSCPGFSTGTTVSMLDSCFSGTAHAAPADSVITVRNNGELPHTYTAVDGSFDSGQVEPGGSFELSISEPGVYQVYCALHGSITGEGMAGALLIGEAVPQGVTSGFDPSAVAAAVAGETRPLAEAINRQAVAIESLEAAQAKLQTRLDGHTASGQPASATPTVVAVPSSASADWLPLATGVAVGLGVAALVFARGSGRRRDQGHLGASPSSTWEEMTTT